MISVVHSSSVGSANMFSKVLSVIVVVAIFGVSAYEHAASYVSRQSHPDLHGEYVGAISTDGEREHEYYGQQENYHHYPAYDYNYKYGVEDYHSGDKKSQNEERHGGVVKGQYSLVQPDGVVRTVKYVADKHNGFRATVYYDGHPTNQGSPQYNHY